MWQDSKTQIVTVVIFTVVTEITIVTYLREEEKTWQLESRWDVLRAAFCDSRDAFFIPQLDSGTSDGEEGVRFFFAYKQMH